MSTSKIIGFLLACVSLSVAGPGEASAQRTTQEREAGLPEASAPTLSVDDLRGYLPDSLGGWERTVLHARDIGAGPMVQAEYERDGRSMTVAIVDLTGQSADDLASYFQSMDEQAGEGEARRVSYGEILAYEGTGISDDVVIPHGALALPGRRFQVTAFEQAEGLTSVADIKALPADTLQAMVARARELVRAVDLERLADVAQDSTDSSGSR